MIAFVQLSLSIGELMATYARRVLPTLPLIKTIEYSPPLPVRRFQLH